MHNADDNEIKPVHPESSENSRMRVYMCKNVHWQSVVETKLYYMSELRLARHHRSNDFPVTGDIVQFLANRILGTAVIKEAYQNGYGAHFILTNINSFVASGPGPRTNSTDLLDNASNCVQSNIERLENESFQLEEEQQNLATLFAALESQKKNIHRRILGKPVKLTENRPKPQKRGVKLTENRPKPQKRVVKLTENHRKRKKPSGTKKMAHLPVPVVTNI